MIASNIYGASGWHMLPVPIPKPRLVAHNFFKNLCTPNVHSRVHEPAQTTRYSLRNQKRKIKMVSTHGENARSTVKKAFNNIPEENKSAGKPRKRWSDNAKNDMKKMGIKSLEKNSLGYRCLETYPERDQGSAWTVQPAERKNYMQHNKDSAHNIYCIFTQHITSLRR
jgi:hypothetical protein